MILWKVFQYTIDGENDHRYFAVKENAEKYYFKCLEEEIKCQLSSTVMIVEFETED